MSFFDIFNQDAEIPAAVLTLPLALPEGQAEAKGRRL